MVTDKGSTETETFVSEFSTQEDNRICYDYVFYTNKATLAIMSIPLVVASINVGTEVIIGFGSEYLSAPRNYEMIVIEACLGICGIQFINLGVLFFLVSMNYNNWLNNLGIFNGSYNEMNSQWYIEYGSMIVTTMILEIPVPHGFPTLIVMI